MTRALLLAAAILAACAEPVVVDDLGDARVGSEPAPAPDASVDARVAMDAGEREDAGDVDAGETMPDAGDAGDLDAGHEDGGDLDAAHEDGGVGYEGECSIIPQLGCESGHGCRARRRSDGSGRFESHCAPMTGRFGYAEGLGECIDTTVFADACQPGMVCGSRYGCELYCEIGGAPEQCPHVRGATMVCTPLDAISDPTFPVGTCRAM